MDMCIRHGTVPDANQTIVFDKFHIAKHLSDVIDKFSRQENKELRR